MAISSGEPKEGPPPRAWAELRDSGLLWLINRTALHPRGFALGVRFDEGGNAVGWQLLGDGAEPWMFLGEDEEDSCFARLEAFLDSHRRDA